MQICVVLCFKIIIITIRHIYYLLQDSTLLKILERV